MKNKFVILMLALTLLMIGAVNAQCPDGIVSYWTFDDGTADDTVDANDGVIYGASWVDGKIGKGLNFPGNFKYVSIPDSTDFDTGLGNAMSVELWIKSTGSAGSSILLSKRATSYAQPRWTLYASSGSSLQLELFASSSWSSRTTSAVSANCFDGEWHHIATTWENGRIPYIYVDGVKMTSWYSTLASGPIARIQGPLYFGSLPSWGSFIGDMDEVAIYNRALTPTEIQEHYQNGLTAQGLCGPADSDGDGITDDVDACDNTPSDEINQIITDETSVWYGCGPSERDVDSDGIGDNFDYCPTTLPEEIPYIIVPYEIANLGCGPSERDTDNDGFNDNVDLCPMTKDDLPNTPILEGCSCYQILQLKPGEDKGEMKSGCSDGTLSDFSARRGWAKDIPKEIVLGTGTNGPFGSLSALNTLTQWLIILTILGLLFMLGKKK